MEAIETENAKEELVGGYQIFDPAAVVKPFEWKVIEYEKKKTEWGTRFDFVGVDSAGFDVTISSWALVSRHKMKPSDMINKTFMVYPLNEKKVKIIQL